MACSKYVEFFGLVYENCSSLFGSDSRGKFVEFLNFVGFLIRIKLL